MAGNKSWGTSEEKDRGERMTSTLLEKTVRGVAAVRPRGWWAGAARILGISPSVQTPDLGRGFDFAALHRSLEGLERNTPSEE